MLENEYSKEHNLYKQKGRQMKKRFLIIFIIFILCCCLGIWFLYESMPETFVKTEYYVDNDSMTSTIRIAHLSDLHNKEYGEDNGDLIQAVKEACPDLIFITGDLVSREDEDITPAIYLVEQLTSLAPVYYSYGNHELMNEERFQRDIGSQVESAGAVVMDYVYQDVEIRGQELRIGGLYGYCVPEKYLKTNEASPLECDFLREFQDTNRTTLLLTHMPYSWLELDGLNEWNVDIIFSGHSHGGQMDLPILGPVYAPDQGWFPDQVSGMFISNDGSSTLIVSRGLGDSVKIPRVNNDWELVVVEVGVESRE